MKMDAKFIKIRSKKDIIISIATVVVGLLLALLPFGSGIKCLGWFIAVTGVVLILALKTSWKNVDDCKAVTSLLSYNLTDAQILIK